MKNEHISPESGIGGVEAAAARDIPVNAPDSPSRLHRVFPFLSWIGQVNAGTIRADFFAALTVAMVLIPQSVAFAQLAGLPAVYGLYAAFLPATVAALFGSSPQLTTGPTAMASLVTAAALAPLASTGSDAYILYAVALCLTAGVVQLVLGLARLGFIVDFLSYPVINGFTNAVAILIAASQLPKLFGVHIEKGTRNYITFVRTIRAAVHSTHWPTLIMAVCALALIIVLRKLSRKLPVTLIVVLLAIVASWLMGFETIREVPLSDIRSEPLQLAVTDFNTAVAALRDAGARKPILMKEWNAARKRYGSDSEQALMKYNEELVLDFRIAMAQKERKAARQRIRAIDLVAVNDSSGEGTYFVSRDDPAANSGDGRRWYVRVGDRALDMTRLTLSAGGDVVGSLPSGLPSLSMPNLAAVDLLRLLPGTILIALLGVMEVVSISRAISSKTGQKMDINQELIGQGLGKISGAFSGSYPVSGSFSRSAVNLDAGAVTGLSNVFLSVIVLLTLLFLTPLLYHLPQAVLGAIIIMAVSGLINIRGVLNIWRVHKSEGVLAVITFLATLYFAPRLEVGILTGAGLALMLFLKSRMKPDMASLSRHPEGALRDARRWGLKTCRRMAVIRFDGSLFFGNIGYMENRILEETHRNPDLRHILFVGAAINDVDATAVHELSVMIRRLRDAGHDVFFSDMKYAVQSVFRRAGLYDLVGDDHFYPTTDSAIAAICDRIRNDTDASACPDFDHCDYLLQTNHAEAKDDNHPGSVHANDE